MNKKKFLACLMAITMLVICIVGTIEVSAIGKSASNSINNSSNNRNKKWYKKSKTKKDDSYKFKVTPDRDPKKWKEFSSHKEKVDACQITDKTLDKISTEGLVDTCLEYPMFGDMILFENVQDGFSNLCDNFNGLEELIDREDSGECLYEIYKSLNFEELLESDDYPLLKLKYLETILAQEEILTSMSKATRSNLLKTCKEYFELKISKYSDILDPIPTAWIITRILKIDNSQFCELVKSNDALRYFEEYGAFENVSLEDVNVAINFIFTAIE